MTRFWILPHLIWEAVLVVLAVVATVVGLTTHGMFSSSVPWASLLLLGTIATGLALSLRTGTPNLAVAGISALGGVVYGELVINKWPVLLSVLVALLTCAVLGLVMAAVTGLTGAPAWAVSLGGLALTQIGGYAIHANALNMPAAGQFHMTVTDIILAVVLLGSIGGGLVFLLPAVRKILGGPDAGQPQDLRQRLLPALVGLVGSSVLAGLGGIIYAGYITYVQPFGYNNQLLLGLGIALLGGVSAFGRGGGIAGTALAAYIVLMAQNLAFVRGWPDWWSAALLPALVLLIGAVVSWLLERFSVRRGGLGPAGPDAAGWPAGTGPAPQPAMAGAATPGAPPMWPQQQPPGWQPQAQPGWQPQPQQPSGPPYAPPYGTEPQQAPGYPPPYQPPPAQQPPPYQPPPGYQPPPYQPPPYQPPAQQPPA